MPLKRYIGLLAALCAVIAITAAWLTTRSSAVSRSPQQAQPASVVPAAEGRVGAMTVRILNAAAGMPIRDAHALARTAAFTLDRIAEADASSLHAMLKERGCVLDAVVLDGLRQTIRTIPAQHRPENWQTMTDDDIVRWQTVGAPALGSLLIETVTAKYCGKKSADNQTDIFLTKPCCCDTAVRGQDLSTRSVGMFYTPPRYGEFAGAPGSTDIVMVEIDAVRADGKPVYLALAMAELGEYGWLPLHVRVRGNFGVIR